MLGDSVFCGQDAGLDIAARKVRDRIAGRLVQQHNVLTVGDLGVAEPHPHPAPQWLRVQQPLRHRLWCEEVPDRAAASGPCCHARPIAPVLPSVTR